MEPNERPGLYYRISRAMDGSTLGVDRQHPPCAAACERLGWEFDARPVWEGGSVYSDNDLSAYSGKRRPAYERLIADIHAGSITAIVCWSADRLTRQPIENEMIIDLAKRYGIKLVTVTGEYDLSTPAGKMNFRNLGTMARYESEHKAERIYLKHEELANHGKYSGGGFRPYGFEGPIRDEHGTVLNRGRIGVAHVEEEVELIQEARDRVLGGQSLRAICRDWDRRGIKSATGKHWSTFALKRLLLSARVIGKRDYHDEIIGDAVWDAIITEDEQEQLRRILDDPTRLSPGLNGLGPAGMARSYLCVGYCVCGYEDCGARMVGGTATGKTGRYRAYSCRKPPNANGCGRIKRHADHVEAHVTKIVLELLHIPEVWQIIINSQHDGTAADFLRQQDSLRAWLQEVTDAYYSPVEENDRIDKPTYIRQKTRIETQLADIQSKLDRVGGGRRPLALPLGQTPVGAWLSGDLDVRRALLGAVVDRIVIHPGGRAGGARFDASKVEVIPRDDVAVVPDVLRVIRGQTRPG